MMQPHAFTRKHNEITNVLKTIVGVTDPIQTRLVNKPESPQTFSAIWDTGATGSVITSKVVNQLGLVPTGMARVNTANDECVRNTYIVDVNLPNNVCVRDVKVTEGTINHTDDLLIGMDIISFGDFSITNFNGKTTFSFTIPSIGEIDFVKDIRYTQEAHSNKVGRNDPCPCGSGKKFKNCHGAT